MSEPSASDSMMSNGNSSSSGATINARVNLTPVASQTFLVAVAVAFCICLVCATALFLAGKDAAWVFVALGTSLIAAALWAWMRSQSDVDLQASAPTVLALPNGATVSTDSRTLRNNMAVTAMLRLFEANQREPLPHADALFDGGVVVPNSADAARERTEQINCQVENQARNFQILLGDPQGEPAVLQSPLQDGLTADHAAAPQGATAN